MTLTQLEYVLAVAEHLNFSRAAEACHVAQPSLSAQIKKLEEELELTIFDRGPNGVRITSEGQAVITQARTVLREAQKISDVRSAVTGEPRGLLRLGIIPTVAPSLLPYVLGPLLREHPGFELQVTEDHTAALIHGLHHGTLDAAILSTPENAPAELIERVLYYEAFVIFAGPRHPFLEKEKIKASELVEHAPVLLDETHCLRDQVEDLCIRARKGSAPSRLQLKRGGPTTLVAIVDQQEAYTLLPVLSADLLTREQRKRLRDVVQPVPSRKISLVSHKSFSKRPLIEAFHRCLDEHLPDSVQRRRDPRGEIMSPRSERFRGD